MIIKRETFVRIVRNVGGFYVDLQYCLKLVRRAGIQHDRDLNGEIILTDDLARNIGQWIWNSDDLKVGQGDQVPLPTPRRIERLGRLIRQERPREPVGISVAPVELRDTYSFSNGPGGNLYVKVSNGRD